MTLDYGEAFAEKRGLVRLVSHLARDFGAWTLAVPLRRIQAQAGRRMSDGEGPRPRADGPGAPRSDGGRAWPRAGFAEVERMGNDGLPVLPHQDLALKRAEKALSSLIPATAQYLRSALTRQRGLAGHIDQQGWGAAHAER